MSESRYHRQTLLPGIGEAGQARLLDSTAVVFGCGALGSAAVDMLARAGVGRIRVVDRDIVEVTNLQRQVLFDEQDVEGRLPKAEAAKRRLARVNSTIEIEAVVDDINSDNIAGLADGADVLIDGLDNFETRYLVNDIAVREGLPYVYGGAVSTQGMVLPILPAGSDRWDDDIATACFRCLFPEAPAPGSTPTCDTVGVLGPMVSVIANIQVAEALKILTGHLASLRRSLLQVDLWSNDIIEVSVQRKACCPTCAERRFDYLDGREGSATDVLCGRDAVQLRQRADAPPPDFGEIAARLSSYGRVSHSNLMLNAWLNDGDTDYEITLFPNGRTLVKGTQDASVARMVVARFIGG